MEAEMRLVRRRLRKWKTVFRLRRLQRIEGQAIQKTLRKTRKHDLGNNTFHDVFFSRKSAKKDLKREAFWIRFRTNLT